MSESRKTASEIQADEYACAVHTSEVRYRLRQAIVEESRRRAISGPQVVAVGFAEYDVLKAGVLSSIAELIPLRTSGSPDCALITELNRVGVECFSWGGILIMRLSSAACGTYFL